MILASFASLFLACSGTVHLTPEQTVQTETVSILPESTDEVTRIYFIHNGESEYSAGAKYTSGRSPEVPLNEKGRMQADRLGTFFSTRITQAIIFLPPAKRAIETITPFLSNSIVIRQYLDGLFEVSMGEWEGKPKDGAYKAEYQTWKDLPAAEKYVTPKVASGESYQEGANRAIKDLGDILQIYYGQTIIIVSGENLLNALAIRWSHPDLSQEPGTDLPKLNMEKGDFFLVEIPHGQSIEQAQVKTLFLFDNTKLPGQT